MNIEIISGSPRHNSVTNRLALYLHQFFTDKTEHRIGLIDVRDYPLGMIQTVYSSPDKAPDDLKPLAERMFAADAFILVTPEYNGGYSPAMQNLLDHFPKQHKKVFGIATASVGGFGGIRASQQMLLFIAALFGIASPYMLITSFVDKKFDADGNLVDESFQANIDTFAHEFLQMAEKMKS